MSNVDSFTNWCVMTKAQGGAELSEATVRNYVYALRNTPKKLDKKFYNNRLEIFDFTSSVEVTKIINGFKATPKYDSINSISHNQFSAALNQFLKYVIFCEEKGEVKAAINSSPDNFKLLQISFANLNELLTSALKEQKEIAHKAIDMPDWEQGLEVSRVAHKQIAQINQWKQQLAEIETDIISANIIKQNTPHSSVKKTVFKKIVDWSLFNYGLSIPQAFVDIILSNLSEEVIYGTGYPIEILIYDIKYSASLNFVGVRSNYRGQLQILFSPSSLIAKKLREIFPISYMVIKSAKEDGTNLNCEIEDYIEVVCISPNTYELVCYPLMQREQKTKPNKITPFQKEPEQINEESSMDKLQNKSDSLEEILIGTLENPFDGNSELPKKISLLHNDVPQNYDVSDWSSVLAKTCEHFILIKPYKMALLTNDKQSGELLLFTYSESEKAQMKQPERMKNGLYVELGVNRKEALQGVMLVLNRCECSPDEIKFIYD